MDEQDEKIKEMSWHNAEHISEDIVYIDDTYTVRDLLSGKGNAAGKVFLVSKGTQLYAAKVLRNRQIYPSQIKYLEKLTDRQYVFPLHYCNQAAKLTLQDKNNKLSEIRAAVVITEFGEHQDLWCFLAKRYKYYINNREDLAYGLPYNIALGLFHQLLLCLKYIHSKGILHRDLKIANVMLGQKFKLKIIDFGFSCDINQTIVMQNVGTSSYLPPQSGFVKKDKKDQNQKNAKSIQSENERNERKRFDEKSQSFMIGMVFFYLCFSRPPFKNAYEPDNKYYKFFRFQNTFSKQKQQTYWEDLKNVLHKKQKIPKQIKSIFSKIFLQDPNKRFSITDLLQSEWFQRMAQPNVIQQYMTKQYELYTANDPKIKKLKQIKQQLKKLVDHKMTEQEIQTQIPNTRAARMISDFERIKNNYQSFQIYKQIYTPSKNIYQKLVFKDSSLRLILSWLQFSFGQMFEQENSLLLSVLSDYKIDLCEFRIKNQNMIVIHMILRPIKQIQEDKKEQQDQDLQQIQRVEIILEGELMYREMDDMIFIRWLKQKGDEFILQILIQEMKNAIQGFIEYQNNKQIKSQ